MTNKNNFGSPTPVSIPMNTYEELGRWLCWQFYRNADELLELYPALYDIFEETTWKDASWAELLSGAFHPSGKMFATTKRAVGAKWQRLGAVVRPEQDSVDGVGKVRAKEILLYLEVAEKFMQALKNELTFD